jgi:hypothetical protein
MNKRRMQTAEARKLTDCGRSQLCLGQRCLPICKAGAPSTCTTVCRKASPLASFACRRGSEKADCGSSVKELEPVQSAMSRQTLFADMQGGRAKHDIGKRCLPICKAGAPSMCTTVCRKASPLASFACRRGSGTRKRGNPNPCVLPSLQTLFADLRTTRSRSRGNSLGTECSTLPRRAPGKN